MGSIASMSDYNAVKVYSNSSTFKSSSRTDEWKGIVKTYSLTYEPGDMLQAVFDRSKASNHWRTHARVLREYVEYFGPRTEQLDIGYEGEQAVFTSFTEKIQHGRGKRPELHDKM